MPQIQRDYAQGRPSEADLRKGFIRKIHETLRDESPPLNLDFIYGFEEVGEASQKIFVPLDGQQRLTTLWLLHWFVAPRVGNADDSESCVLTLEAQSYLQGFTYETRLASKRFCKALVSKALVQHESVRVSELIKDAPWFMASWGNDPTVGAMLNTLDTIQMEYFASEETWEKLVAEQKVTFDYINIRAQEFRLTDELYIKMNSRGKPLTAFENFKAQFAELLDSGLSQYQNETLQYGGRAVSYQQYFSFKIDSAWMDLFWSYRGATSRVDVEVMRFVVYVAQMLFFRKNEEDGSAFSGNFDSLRTVFSDPFHSKFLFDSLDFLAGLQDAERFFADVFSSISLFEVGKTNLFQRAIRGEDFDVKHRVLLYAILHYCIETQDMVVTERMKDYVRIVRNLLLGIRQINSTNRTEYTSNLRLPNFYGYSQFIDGFVANLVAEPSANAYSVLHHFQSPGFPPQVINNERKKANAIAKQPAIKTVIQRLEEHDAIQSVVANFNLEHDGIQDRANAFYEIWNEQTPTSHIVRALLTVGDHSVCTHNSALGDIWYFGTRGGWNRILTASDDEEKKRIAEVLDRFFSKYLATDGATSQERLAIMIEQYEPQEFDWMYYFIKYDAITGNVLRPLNVFGWVNESNVNSLGNAGNQPFHSYHLNPYLIVLQRKFAGTKKVSLFYGRFGEVSHLRIDNRVNIDSVDGEGAWRIREILDSTITQSLIEQFGLVPNSDWYDLPVRDGEDRIETVTAFIKTLLAL